MPHAGDRHWREAAGELTAGLAKVSFSTAAEPRDSLVGPLSGRPLQAGRAPVLCYGGTLGWDHVRVR